MRIVGIVFWRGKAYLPVKAQLESGPFVDLEPVYVVDFDPEELLSATNKVLAAGHPKMQDLTLEEWEQRKSPILTATKARSWKELARTAATYTIEWGDKGFIVDMSRLDKEGRWEWDPEKRRIFPIETPLQEIIAVILEDIRSRPEVWQ